MLSCSLHFTAKKSGHNSFNLSTAIKEPNSNNYLIVGAGLAGCVLGRRLEERGLDFKIVGNPNRPSAADVAAGIINPVTGRWMTKSWRIDDFAPEAETFYRKFESDFGISVYHPIPATRFCLNTEDVKRFQRRLRNPRYQDVLEAFQEPGEESADYRDDHGSVRISKVAWVDLPRVVQALRQHFTESQRLQSEDFDHAQLAKSDNGWSYEGATYQTVIFCEGAALPSNPWFSKLPFSPAKGETLLCRSENSEASEKLIHHEKWILPYADGSFRIGATYDEDDLSLAPTEQGKATLTNAFAQLTHTPRPLQVEKHLAGIRPSTKDARPLLGRHANEKQLIIFNGLGAKGASLAPTLSRELTEFMVDGRPLDPETDISRFETDLDRNGRAHSE